MPLRASVTTDPTTKRQQSSAIHAEDRRLSSFDLAGLTTRADSPRLGTPTQAIRHCLAAMRCPPERSSTGAIDHDRGAAYVNGEGCRRRRSRTRRRRSSPWLRVGGGGGVGVRGQDRRFPTSQVVQSSSTPRTAVGRTSSNGCEPQHSVGFADPRERSAGFKSGASLWRFQAEIRRGSRRMVLGGGSRPAPSAAPRAASGGGHRHRRSCACACVGRSC